ncbi:somatostatin-1-like [Vanacampus margaritifer]
MKMYSSSSRGLLLLLLAVCASTAVLTRTNARRGATLHSYKQDWVGPSAAEAVLLDLLQMAAEEDERGDGAEDGAELQPSAGVADPAGLQAAALGPRERKAGCKNFFWKTFTSC